MENQNTNPEITSNEVVRSILERRSIRRFHPDPVSETQLETLLECGFSAPSGMNGQGWFLSVIRDRGLLDEIHALHMQNLPPEDKRPPVLRERLKNLNYDVFFHAPLVILVSNDEEKGPLGCGLLGQNIVIAAQSMGLGTCYLGGILQLLQSSEGESYLSRMKVPDGFKPCFMIAIGKPDECPAATPRDRSKFVMIDAE